MGLVTWKSLRRILTKQKKNLPDDPAILLHDMYLKNSTIHSANAFSVMLIAALFIELENDNNQGSYN